MDSRGFGFAPQNSIKSTAPPDFRQRNFTNKQTVFQSPGSNFSTPETSAAQGKTLSDLGDSSSIFAFKSPDSVDLGKQAVNDNPTTFIFGAGKGSALQIRPIAKPKPRRLLDSSPSSVSSSASVESLSRSYKGNTQGYIPGISKDLRNSPSPSPSPIEFGRPASKSEQPIPFTFGVKDTRTLPRDGKMARERSPAKAPLATIVPNDQASKQQDTTKPMSGVPQFGQTSLPQSPLFRPPPKEKSVFIEPKARTEHHRDPIALPHLQAFKDVTRKIIDPLMPRAPAAYLQPTAAPALQTTSYTTTKAASQPMFGSSGTTYGSFQATSNVSYSHNYIDLTANNHRETYEPHTFVDPAKAQEDLKALLEGVIEDEDDVPRTRLRKKKKDATIDKLSSQLSDLGIVEGKQGAISDDEEEEEDDGSVEGIKVKLLPHQVEGVEWMKGRELGNGKKGRVPKGGILADDMGLGKTLQSIALILTNPKPTDEATIIKRKLASGVEKTTLVVAPLALIRQWEIEIKDKVLNSHTLRVCVHHGPQRTKRFADLKKFDVVITTYQILVSEFGNSSTDASGLKVGCFGLHWYRVILDEAHTIKNRNAKATQACYALRSEYRWCLSGTPMQNNLDELQSLIKFLRIKPYDDLREWKDMIDKPMKNGRGDVAIKRLRAFLQILMKRRTKDILKKEGALNPGGRPSAVGQGSTTGFKVTERKIENVLAEFSAEERHFYERLEARTDASIEQMMAGEKVNYASALTLLLRLRQACNHPKLCAGKLSKDKEALSAETTSSQKKKSSDADVDDMADMFGAMGVSSQKCEVCQLELGKTAIAEGAIRCLDCEADLADVTKQHKSRKEKKKKRHHDRENEPKPAPARKPRNRNIIEDSDDDEEAEEAGGSWIVPEGQRGSLKLGKAGGQEDEDAEGGGRWLNSDDDDSSIFPELSDIKPRTKKPIALDTDSEDDGENSQSGSDSNSASNSASNSDVEDEIQSSSDEEAQLATISTSTKITYLLKILAKEADEHKFIVFSQFTSMLDLIEPFLRQKGFKYTRYDGSMKNDMREASLGKLRNDKNCRVLLCSLKCGSLGLNLTAATRVVILEPFWNPFVEEQAIDRVHRLTQKIDVIVYKITIKDTVEERILDLQEKKRELANQTIEGGKGGAGKLGMKEILQLFRRDAEHTHPVGNDMSNYDLGNKPRILKEREERPLVYSSNSRESSAPRENVKKVSSMTREDNVYGRRW